MKLCQLFTISFRDYKQRIYFLIHAMRTGLPQSPKKDKDITRQRIQSISLVNTYAKILIKISAN